MYALQSAGQQCSTRHFTHPYAVWAAPILWKWRMGSCALHFTACRFCFFQWLTTVNWKRHQSELKVTYRYLYFQHFSWGNTGTPFNKWRGRGGAGLGGVGTIWVVPDLRSQHCWPGVVACCLLHAAWYSFISSDLLRRPLNRRDRRS